MIAELETFGSRQTPTDASKAVYQIPAYAKTHLIGEAHATSNQGFLTFIRLINPRIIPICATTATQDNPPPILAISFRINGSSPEQIKCMLITMLRQRRPIIRYSTVYNMTLRAPDMKVLILSSTNLKTTERPKPAAFTETTKI